MGKYIVTITFTTECSEEMSKILTKIKSDFKNIDFPEGAKMSRIPIFLKYHAQR